MQKYRLEVIDDFCFTVSGVKIQLRTYNRLLSILAVNSGILTRQQVAEWIVPGVTPKIVRNRLRVAISTLKTKWPDLLIVSGSTVELNRNLVSCDAWELRESIDDASNTVSEEEELLALQLALSCTNHWKNVKSLGVAAATIVDAVVGACLRTCDLAQKCSNPAAGIRAAKLGVELAENNVMLWRFYLTFHFKLGLGAQALADYKRKGQPHAEDAELVSVVSKIRSVTRNLLSVGQHDQLILDLFNKVGESDPDTCLKLLASPASLNLAGKYPSQMRSLLASMTHLSANKDETWERCMARQLGLSAWLGDAESVLTLAPPLLATSQQPPVLRATWNAVMVAHSLRRDWDSTEIAYQKTLEFARLTGDEVDVLSAQGNAASFLMIRGDYEGAERLYDESLEKLRKLGTARSEFDWAVGLGNRAFIPIFQGDLRRAMVLLEEAIELRSKEDKQVQLGLLLVALAYVKTALGDKSDVIRLVRQSLLDAFACGSARYQQMTFEYFAALLAHTSERTNVRPLLEWVQYWRTATRMPRAEAEIQLCARAEKLAGDSKTDPIASDALPTQVGRDLMKKLRRAVSA